MKTHKLLPFAALALILLTNTLALGGAAWNRRGEPESRLTLSQRELRLPYRGFDRENSGQALTLNWRVAGVAVDNNQPYWDYHNGGAPEWLDRAKMESLGFAQIPSAGDDHRRRTGRALSRDVLLVLEFAGEASRKALERARQHQAEEEGKWAAAPDSNEKKNRLKLAADRLLREENESSRLFVVDAGLDAVVLRSKYPDRRRYAIVRGQVRPFWNGERNVSAARGHVSNLSIAGINVPYAYRNLLGATAGQEKFTADVEFGQRLEPWIARLEVVFR